MQTKPLMKTISKIWLLKIACITNIFIMFPGSSPAQKFPNNVFEFIPGKNAGFGGSDFPNNVIGAPSGSTSPLTPNFDPAKLLSLGTGGIIILEFTSDYIIDGPGVDFTVFENPVQPEGFPEYSFTETALISVSEDGVTWTQFPVELLSTNVSDLMKKSNYIGYAGVQPVLFPGGSNISPFDVTQSGGDQFDLHDIGMTRCRFIRIQDTGHSDYNPTFDKNNVLNTDFGNLTDPSPNVQSNTINTAGFDLDGIAAIHTEPMQSNIVGWSLY